jgi:hypothetical protein
MVGRALWVMVAVLTLCQAGCLCFFPHHGCRRCCYPTDPPPAVR